MVNNLRIVLYTKGEVLQSCKNAALLRRLARLTVSCSHPEQGRFEHQPYGNCGYCFPCIIRRASLHTIGLDFAGDYRHDVCSEEQLITGRTMRSRDIRAVLAALAQEDESQLLPLMAGPLPPEVPLSAATRVYHQSLAEVRNWFLGNASPAVRRAAGL